MRETEHEKRKTLQTTNEPGHGWIPGGGTGLGFRLDPQEGGAGGSHEMTLITDVSTSLSLSLVALKSVKNQKTNKNKTKVIIINK